MINLSKLGVMHEIGQFQPLIWHPLDCKTTQSMVVVEHGL